MHASGWCSGKTRASACRQARYEGCAQDRHEYLPNCLPAQGSSQNGCTSMWDMVQQPPVLCGGSAQCVLQHTPVQHAVMYVIIIRSCLQQVPEYLSAAAAQVAAHTVSATPHCAAQATVAHPGQ